MNIFVLSNGHSFQHLLAEKTNKARQNTCGDEDFGNSKSIKLQICYQLDLGDLLTNNGGTVCVFWVSPRSPGVWKALRLLANEFLPEL